MNELLAAMRRVRHWKPKEPTPWLAVLDILGVGVMMFLYFVIAKLLME